MPSCNRRKCQNINIMSEGSEEMVPLLRVMGGGYRHSGRQTRVEGCQGEEVGGDVIVMMQAGRIGCTCLITYFSGVGPTARPSVTCDSFECDVVGGQGMWRGSGRWPRGPGPSPFSRRRSVDTYRWFQPGFITLNSLDLCRQLPLQSVLLALSATAGLLVYLAVQPLPPPCDPPPSPMHLHASLACCNDELVVVSLKSYLGDKASMKSAFRYH
jgi:hypothetical protein